MSVYCTSLENLVKEYSSAYSREDYLVNNRIYDLPIYERMDNINAENIAAIKMCEQGIRDAQGELAKAAMRIEILAREIIRRSENLDRYFYLTFESADRMEENYKKDGFSDKEVKFFVKNVREVFFDDTKECFQNFNASDFSLNDYIGNSITIKFRDKTDDFEIGISIPGKSQSSYNSSNPYEHVNDGEYVLFMKKPGESTKYVDYHTRVMASYEIVPIRKKILEIVERKNAEVKTKKSAKNG